MAGILADVRENMVASLRKEALPAFPGVFAGIASLAGGGRNKRTLRFVAKRKDYPPPQQKPANI